MNRSNLKKKLLTWQAEIAKQMLLLEDSNNPKDDDLLESLENLYDALDAVICGELRYVS